MFKELLASARVCGLTILICVVAYPLVILGVAAVVASEARMGSLVTDDAGNPVGSLLIAQSFTQPEYFWPRPSACNFDASAAAGSNLSPTNPAIRERAVAVIGRLAPIEGTAVPADLVTASGAGLDPHISLAAARIQAVRIAKAREIDENRVLELIDRHTERIPLSAENGAGIVNVLAINLALDAKVPLREVQP